MNAEDTNLPKTEEETTSSTRGGARAGAGRKRKYANSYDYRRLKCISSCADLARAFIMILEKNVKWIERTWVTACKLDGTEAEEKGSGRRSWTDCNAISSEFSLDVNLGSGSYLDGAVYFYDKRIFLLAYLLVKPYGVRIDSMRYRKVRLRWQHPEEVARLMSQYGSLMARRNKLPYDLRSILKSIPEYDDELEPWIKKNC